MKMHLDIPKLRVRVMGNTWHVHVRGDELLLLTRVNQKRFDFLYIFLVKRPKTCLFSLIFWIIQGGNCIVCRSFKLKFWNRTWGGRQEGAEFNCRLPTYGFTSGQNATKCCQKFPVCCVTTHGSLHESSDRCAPDRSRLEKIPATPPPEVNKPRLESVQSQGHNNDARPSICGGGIIFFS